MPESSSSSFWDAVFILIRFEFFVELFIEDDVSDWVIEDDVVVAKTDKEEVVLHEEEIQEAKNDEVEYVDPTIKQRYHSKHKKKWDIYP